MEMHMTNPRTPKAKLLFNPGKLVMTPGAMGRCPPARMLACLIQHVGGDWGCVCDADKKENELAIKEQLRIVSAYPIDPTQPSKGYGANTLWIITERDRSLTTFLLPEEY